MPGAFLPVVPRASWDTKLEGSAYVSPGHSCRMYMLALQTSPLENCLLPLSWELRDTVCKPDSLPSTGDPDGWKVLLGNVTEAAC